MTDEPMKFSNDPLTYFKRTEDHSRRAIYTCEVCGCKHKGWKPEECYECGHDELDWSYAYGPRRFA